MWPLTVPLSNQYRIGMRSIAPQANKLAVVIVAEVGSLQSMHLRQRHAPATARPERWA